MRCEEARTLLDALVGGTLNAEQQGRLEGHVYSCDDCADALGQRIAEGIVRGEIPQPAGVRREPVLRARTGVFWHPSHLHQDHRVVAGLRRRYTERFQPREIGARRIRTRGQVLSKTPEQVLDVQTVDAAWNVTGRQSLPCQVIQPATLTAGGSFSLRLRITGEEARRFDGWNAICVMKLSAEDRISFVSKVEDGRMEFAGEALPELGAEVRPPMDIFEFYLTPEDLP
jgi:hypothetical protein